MNLWVRSEQHLYSPDTLELVPDDLKADYVRIVSNLAITGAALAEAQAEYQAAVKERNEFFDWITHV